LSLHVLYTTISEYIVGTYYHRIEQTISYLHNINFNNNIDFMVHIDYR